MMSIAPCSATGTDTCSPLDSVTLEDPHPRLLGNRPVLRSGWVRQGVALGWLSLRASASGVGSTAELWDAVT